MPQVQKTRGSVRGSSALEEILALTGEEHDVSQHGGTITPWLAWPPSYGVMTESIHEVTGVPAHNAGAG